MKQFKIYAGLKGIFGGATFLSVEEFKNEDEALDYAYFEAVSEYEERENNKEVPSFDSAIREAVDKLEGADDESDATLYALSEQIYQDYISLFVEYKVEEVV